MNFVGRSPVLRTRHTLPSCVNGQAQRTRSFGICHTVSSLIDDIRLFDLRALDQTESKMDLSKELLTSRAAYFEALDTGEDVWLPLRHSEATHAPDCSFPSKEAGDGALVSTGKHGSESVVVRELPGSRRCNGSLVCPRRQAQFGRDTRDPRALSSRKCEQILNKKFTYAWCLIHLKTRDDILGGISLLKVSELRVTRNFSPDIPALLLSFCITYFSRRCSI
jgi:hypothetical protein